MNLETAIKILRNYEKGSDEAEPLDFDRALKLGIEALKRVAYPNRGKPGTWGSPLPGETKE